MSNAYSNFFLTGSRKSGKSTVIREIMKCFPDRFSGFLTLPDQWSGQICTYKLVDILSNKEGPVSCWIGNEIEPVTETFDTLGIEVLEDYKRFPMVIMDELGRFERNCFSFIKKINEIADSDVLLLAALKKEDIGFINELKKRKDSIVWDLDEIGIDAAQTKVKYILAEKGL